MSKKLFITDQRMLELMDWAITNGVAVNQGDYLDRIEFTRNNLSKVRDGIQGFTKEQILKACLVTGVSADWIYGLSNQMMRKANKLPIELLKEAVIAIEHDMITRR